MSFARYKESIDTTQQYSGKVITLYPTEEQKKYLDRCIELHRFVYNWTIEQYEEHYNFCKENNLEVAVLNQSELQKRLSKLRNENEWLKDVPLHTLRNGMIDAINAYDNFFKNPKCFKHPKFKTKKKSKKSFAPRIDNSFYFEDNLIHIEGFSKNEFLKSKFKSGYHKSDNKKFINVRITKGADDQYRLSFSVLTNKPCYDSLDISDNDNLIYTPKYNRAIGIDLNVKSLIVTSYNEGEIYKAPNIKSKVRRIKRLQRKCNKDRIRYKQNMTKEQREIYNSGLLSLSEIESKNGRKRRIKLAKLHGSVTNTCETYIHTTIKNIVTRFPEAIVMEDLNVKEMRSNHFVASAMGVYTPFGKIREIAQQKCDSYNVPFLLAPRDYPSSQLCSKCGSIKKIGSQKTYICPVCGNRMDRDINASFNLENYYYAIAN